MLIQTGLKQGKAVGKASAAKRERRKERLTAAGKTHAVRASGMREAGFGEEGETQKVSNRFHLGLAQQFLLWMDPGQRQPSGHSHFGV